MTWSDWKRCVVEDLLAVVLLYLALSFVSTIHLFPQPVSVTRPAYLTIDDVVRGGLRVQADPLLFLPSSCRPQHDVVLVKSPHSSPDVVDMMLRRYVYRHNLSAVLPRGQRSDLGWPWPVRQRHYRPADHRFNVLSELAVFNASTMKTIVNDGAVFVAMLRHPLDLVVSALHSQLWRGADTEGGVDYGKTTVSHNSHSFSTQQALTTSREHHAEHSPSQKLQDFNVTSMGSSNQSYPSSGSGDNNIVHHGGDRYRRSILESLEAFLQQKTPGAQTRQAPSSRCRPDNFPLSHSNPQSRCLAIPDLRLDPPPDRVSLTRHLHHLQSQFLLVMVREHLDESLVVLKRLLCWEFKDIVFVGGQEDDLAGRDVVQKLSDEAQTRHREANSVDYMLYEHFNATLWSTVHRHGPDFWEDLQYFRHVRQQVTWYCRHVVPYGGGFLQLPESVSSPAWRFTSDDCHLMKASLLDLLKHRHQQQHPHDTAGDDDSDEGAEGSEEGEALC